MFPEKAEAFDSKHCTSCGKPIIPATEFRDPISEKEYQISGLCKKCIDDTFSVNEDP